MKVDIDLVYLWVDGNDPQWKAKRDMLRGNDVRDDSQQNGKDCDGRYADNDELRYSLRSVAMYAPWIRRIFIVTDGQTPDWLDISHPKIRLVDHKEILPPEVLPTFNSTVIEHMMFRIPGLSEQFLYANDDMFFGRPVSPTDFFTADGRPIIRFNRRLMRRATLWFKEKIQGKTLSNYNRTIQNAARLVQQKYGIYVGHKTHHNIDAYCRSDYEHAFEMFREEITSVMGRHFRSDDDIQRNLYSYTAMVEGKAKVRFVGNKESFKFHIDNPCHYAKLERYKPMLFCLNDSEYATDDDRASVRNYLQKRFNEKSEFEL